MAVYNVIIGRGGATRNNSLSGIDHVIVIKYHWIEDLGEFLCLAGVWSISYWACGVYL